MPATPTSTDATYRTFEVLASIDGVAKFFEIAAVSLDAAMADIREVFCGEVSSIQYKVR
jgi:hypothetical protein